jgi:hypothetical protein
MATAQATTSDPQLGFPAKGSLKRFAFPRLMREVARNKLTGSLYLLNGQTKKVVFFEEGQPVFVRSNVLSECLGQILSSEGLITQEQCEQTLEAIRRTGKKQGELLVEMGILSEGNLRYGLEAQLRAKLYDIFAWDDGRYQFKLEPTNLQFGIRLELCAEGVIIGAIQDQYSEERAAIALQPYLDKYLVLRMGLDVEPSDLALLPEEEFFVESLDGSRTVSAFVNEPFEPAIPTPNALVFGLLQAGVAQLGDRAQEARPGRPLPDLSPKPPPDEKLAPPFEAQDVVTEYEDTPLPGELPKVRGLLGDHEAGFDDVGDDDEGGHGLLSGSRSVPPPSAAPVREADVPTAALTNDPTPSSRAAAAEGAAPGRSEVSQELVKAEPESIEETFDDNQIELSEEDELAIEELDDVVEVVDSTSAERLDLDEVPDSIEPELLTPADLGSPMDSGGVVLGDDLRATFAEPLVSRPLGTGTAPPNGAPRVAPAGPARVAPARQDQAAAGLGADDDLMLEDDASADDLDDLDLDPDAMLPDLDALEVDPDLEFGSASSSGRGRTQGRPMLVQPKTAGDDELVDFDELDAVDLGDGEMAAASNDAFTGGEPTIDGDDNPEMMGAMRFNEAESALGTGDHGRAVALLEEAYDNGFDVAELHAMLAYARFMASGGDLETAQHAFELLDYAQQMDPSLDLVHAYRGAIHKTLGRIGPAREALGRALELNPYCELAIQLMDSL